MKHLKSYNESIFNFLKKKKKVETFNIQDLKDICLELEDGGLRTNVSTIRKEEKPTIVFPKNCNIIYRIEIWKGHGNDLYTLFSYSEISEVVERLMEYTKGCGFTHFNKVDILTPMFHDYGFESRSITIKELEGRAMSKFTIEFYEAS